MRILALLLVLAGLPAAALTLPEGAVQTAQMVDTDGIWPVPDGPAMDATVPVTDTPGARTRSAWRVPGDPDPAALLATLRRAAESDGWQIDFTCADRACGGFDFRFALDLIPEPDMHVNLGDFDFLAARRDGPAGPERLTVLTSRGGGVGYVHLTTVTPAGTGIETGSATTVALAPDLPANDLPAELARRGRAVLGGVAFATGSAALDPGSGAALAPLADWLRDNPGARIVLVGHTDFDGALAGNIDLSRRRAAAVLDYLVDEDGIDPAQLSAEGVGYLVPLVANTSPEGRARNRRVEAVVTELP